MPRATKRKNAASATKASSSTAVPKKQPKQDGQKAVSKDLNIPIDEGFGDFSKGETIVFVDDDGLIFDVSLNQTNIGKNANKFYRLQVLKQDKGKKWFCHTRWGRVGEYGQVKTMGPTDFESAMKDFEKKFKDKSGHKWEDRDEPPKSGKYTYIEKNYEDDDEEEDDAGVKKEEGEDSKDAIPSDLPMATQRLMELIFNQNHFNSVLESIGYNQEKLPLGKLGKSTLKKGFEHLRELASLIKHPTLAQNKYNISQKEAIEDFSNRYYSAIPHIFGRDRAPMIDNDDILRREVAMLDTLSDMEVANTIMKSTDDRKKTDSESVSLIDKRFAELGMEEMTPLDKKSQEYKELSAYLIGSSGKTHNIRYRLQEIFRIERHGENDRFEQSQYAKIGDKNRRLLWHGSRTTNFGGILSQGLRIAPPEAPVNGYAFGKGVYMADMSSKSANYCLSGMSGGTGLLLLCEAELGNPMYEIPSGNSAAEEECKKKNCIATLGVGRTVPPEWKDAGCVHKSLKGVQMPDAKYEPGDNKNTTLGYLQYNEYIAYDVAQIRLRYLFRVDM